MSDNYLWDRSGPRDPDIERLEAVLGTLRSSPPPPAWPDRPALIHDHRGWSVTYLAAAAVLVIACGLSLWSLTRPVAPSWPVVRVEGTPLVGSTPVTDGARLAIGQWLETDARSRATLAVGDIGRLDIDPGSRVQLVTTTAGHHRLALPRGTVHAFIWAPPRQFFIDTPSSTAVDLGCAYTLTVAADGSGMIEVTAGWVALEHDGREALIPAGAFCATRRGLGPGTPYVGDAPDALRAALDTLDGGGTDEPARLDALDRLLQVARPSDAFTVWHLLSRVLPGERDRVFDALARLVPPPPGITKAGIRSGDRRMLETWWDALGLGSTSWWREWQRQWP